MIEELKAIVNDVQRILCDNGWMGALKACVEIGKKQAKDEWQHYEWTPMRQRKLDWIDASGRKMKVSAAHMADGFKAICKPQWTPRTPVLSQEEVMMQYVMMHMFVHRESQGVPIEAADGFAWLNKKIDNIK